MSTVMRVFISYSHDSPEHEKRVLALSERLRRDGLTPRWISTSTRKLIEECGYWRRKEQLEDAEEAAKSW